VNGPRTLCRQEMRVHTRLLLRAKEWESKAQDKSFLLRGKDLQDAEECQGRAGSGAPKPTALQSQYVLASRQVETHRQRFTLAAVVCALLLVSGLAIVAFVQRSVARTEAAIAVSRHLAAQSQQVLDADIGVALQRAVEAMQHWPTEEADVVLRRLLEGPLMRFILHHEALVLSVSFSPDSKRIVAASGDKAARVWDAQNGHVLATLSGHTDAVIRYSRCVFARREVDRRRECRQDRTGVGCRDGPSARHTQWAYQWARSRCVLGRWEADRHR